MEMGSVVYFQLQYRDKMQGTIVCLSYIYIIVLLYNKMADNLRVSQLL